jgi:hypothetical protein
MVSAEWARVAESVAYAKNPTNTLDLDVPVY